MSGQHDTMTVAVYCASSDNIDASFKQAAHQVGSLLARHGTTVVCGGGRQGLMAQVIDGEIEQGGRAVGVLPEFMVERRWDHPSLSERIVTDGMHSRKATMLSMADAVIALPGGIGTYEELLEALTWRQLNLFKGRIVILNLNGFYDPLIAQLDRSVEMGFMRDDHTALWQIASTAQETVAMALEPDSHDLFTQKIR